VRPLRQAAPRRAAAAPAAYTSGYVRIRQHTAAYGSIRQHTSGYVRIRQDTAACVRIRQDTSGYGSIRQHTSAYAYSGPVEPEQAQRGRGCTPQRPVRARLSAPGIRQHTSAYVSSIRQRREGADARLNGQFVHVCQRLQDGRHTSAYVSIRQQHTSACVGYEVVHVCQRLKCWRP
jgi:hypothetical protein